MHSLVNHGEETHVEVECSAWSAATWWNQTLRMRAESPSARIHLHAETLGDKDGKMGSNNIKKQVLQRTSKKKNLKKEKKLK